MTAAERGDALRCRPGGVSAAQKPGKDIVLRKGCRPKMLAGGEQNEDQQGQSIGDDNEVHHLPKGGHIKKESIDQRTNEKDEPKQIGDQRPLAEGDEIIQGTVDGVIDLSGAEPLQQKKDQTKERPVKQQLGVAVLRGIQPLQAGGSFPCAGRSALPFMLLRGERFVHNADRPPQLKFLTCAHSGCIQHCDNILKESQLKFSIKLSLK